MEHKNLIWYSQIDINAALNGGVADAGVTYEVPELYADVISVDAAGIVTPLQAPPDGIDGAVVVVKNTATGKEVGKVIVVVEMGDLEVPVVTIAPGVDVSPPFAPFLTATWRLTAGNSAGLESPSGEIFVEWDEPYDPESGVISSVLSIVAEDASDDLVVNEDVLATPTNVNTDRKEFVALRTANGKRYVVTLVVTNGENIDTTRVVYVDVPDDVTPPYIPSLFAYWEADAIHMEWPEVLDWESTFILEATIVAQDGSDNLAVATAVTGQTSFSVARLRNGKAYDVTLRATNSEGLESAITATVFVPDVTDPIVTLRAMWEPEQAIVNWGISVDPYTTVASAVLSIVENGGDNEILCQNLDVMGLSRLTFPKVQEATGATYDVELVVTDAWGNVTTTNTTLVIPAISANLPPVVERLTARWVPTSGGQIFVEWSDMYDLETLVADTATIWIESADQSHTLAEDVSVGVVYGSGAYAVARTPNDTVYLVTLTVTDEDGNSAEYFTDVRVPAQAPPAASVDISWSGNLLEIAWDANQGYAPLSSASLSVAAVDGSETFMSPSFVGFSGNISFPRTRNGKAYIATLTVIDQDGFVTTRTSTVQLLATNLAPEILSLLARWQNNEIVVDWVATDEDDNIVTQVLSIEAQDASEVLVANDDVQGLSTASYARTALAAAVVYDVTLTVTDAGGLSDTMVVTVVVPGPTTNRTPVIEDLALNWAADTLTATWSPVVDPDGIVVSLTLSLTDIDNEDVLATNVDVLGDVSDAYPRTRNGKRYVATLTATDNDGGVAVSYASVTVPDMIGADETGPAINIDIEWAPEELRVQWRLHDRSGVALATLRVQSEDGTVVFANNVNALTGNGTATYPRTRDGKTYVATIVAEDDLGNQSIGSASCKVDDPLINDPVNVTFVNNGDNTATVTWNNTDNVSLRTFYVGIRELNSDPLETNPSLDRLLQVDGLYAGLGPHSFTFAVPQSIANGFYDIYVQDSVTLNIGFAANEEWERFYVAESIFTGLTGVWNPSAIQVTWGAIVDPGLLVDRLMLSVASQNGMDVFSEENVTADLDRAMDFARTMNGLRYNVTLKAYRADNELLDVTTVTVQVPHGSNRPINVSAEDSVGTSNAVAVAWSNTLNALGNEYYIGVRRAGTIANHTVSNGRVLEFGPVTKDGLGAHAHTLAMGLTPSGVYEIYVQDKNSSLLGYTRVEYVADDLTDPVTALNASWAADVITVTFSASDPESDITRMWLTVISQDDLDVLAEDLDVLGDVNGEVTFPRTKNGKTYDVTLYVVNEAGFTKTTTTTVVVPENLVVLTATDGDEGSITVQWTNMFDLDIGLNNVQDEIRIRVFDAASGGNEVHEFTGIAWDDAGQLVISDPNSLGLAPNVDYWFRIYSYDTAISQYSSMRASDAGRYTTGVATLTATAGPDLTQASVQWTNIDTGTLVSGGAPDFLKITEVNSGMVWYVTPTVNGSRVVGWLPAGNRQFTIRATRNNGGSDFQGPVQATSGVVIVTDSYTGMVVPDMTANSSSELTITTANPGSGDPWKMFDRDSATYFDHQNNNAQFFTTRLQFASRKLVEKFMVKVPEYAKRDDSSVGITISIGEDSNTIFYTESFDLDDMESGPISLTTPASGAFVSIQMTGGYSAANAKIEEIRLYGGDGLNILTPQMSGNTTPVGVASASSELNAPSQGDAWRAFDRTYYQYLYGWRSANVAGPHWLRFDFPVAQTAEFYAITWNQSEGTGDTPKDWTLQGSNNGTSWTTLDTQNDVAWTSGDSYKQFPISSPQAFTKYRIHITETTDGQNYVGIDEFLLYGDIVDYTAPVVVADTDWTDVTEDLTTTWTATDPESAIVSANVLIKVNGATVFNGAATSPHAYNIPATSPIQQVEVTVSVLNDSGLTGTDVVTYNIPGDFVEFNAVGATAGATSLVASNANIVTSTQNGNSAVEVLDADTVIVMARNTADTGWNFLQYKIGTNTWTTLVADSTLPGTSFSSMCVDRRTGNIYVLNGQFDIIYNVNTGETVFDALTGSISAMDLHEADNALYVVGNDTALGGVGYAAIIKIDLSDHTSTYLTTSGQFAPDSWVGNSYDIAVAPSGTIYVSNPNDSDLYKWTGGNTGLVLHAAGFGRIESLEVDKNGNVFGIDHITSNSIKKCTPAGVVSTFSAIENTAINGLAIGFPDGSASLYYLNSGEGVRRVTSS
jgi:F5/8 type C domain